MTGYASHAQTGSRNVSLDKHQVYGAQENHIRRILYQPNVETRNLSRYSSNLYGQSSYLKSSKSQPRKFITERTNGYSMSNSSDIVRPATRYSRTEAKSGYSSDSDYKTLTTIKHTERLSDISTTSSKVAAMLDLNRGSSSLSKLSPLDRKPELVTVHHQPYKDKYVPSFSGGTKRSSLSSFQTSTSKTSSSFSSTSSLTSNGLKHELVGNVGLKNIGNTCFMNSILQCLSNTTILRDYCIDEKYITDINRNSPMKGNLIREFADLLKHLWKPNGVSLSPVNFKSKIQKFSPRFMGYEQQDSQEFLRFLLEGLHEDINRVRHKSSQPLGELSHLSSQEKARSTWKWYNMKDDSFIFDLFVGQLESSLKCQECGNISLTYDPFWDLSLPISKKMYSNDATTLSDCLDTFTRRETLEGDERPMCEVCKVRCTMTKKLSVNKFPKVLVLHLKRFNEGSRYRQKLNNLVKFPVKGLNLADYASKTFEGDSPPIYDLYAVSNHCGSCYGGHYTAYCFNTTTRQWKEFNDSSVKVISDSGICTNEAYVLFYVRKDRTARL